MPNKTPANRPLTVKQTKFVKEYVSNDGNGQHAALYAYDTVDPNTARAIASEVLTKPNVKDAITQALEKHKITLDAAIKPIAAGLKAGTPGYRDLDGKYHKGAPDHSTRLHASRMALKLLGAEAQDPNPGTTLNFNFGTQTFVKGGNTPS